MENTDRIARRIAQQKKAYETRKAKLRNNYRYAREKGFTPTEAKALSFESKEVIDRLAASR